jgi:hypothetical protein
LLLRPLFLPADGGLDLTASAAIVPQDDLPSLILRLTFQTQQSILNRFDISLASESVSSPSLL